MIVAKRRLTSTMNPTPNQIFKNIQETSTDSDHDVHAYRVMEELLNNCVKVRLLRPLAEDGVTPYGGGTQRGEGFGLLAVVCVSVDGGKA